MLSTNLVNNENDDLLTDSQNLPIYKKLIKLATVIIEKYHCN